MSPEAAPETQSSAEALPELYFAAVNAGYDTSDIKNNFDFFELRKTTQENLLLNDFVIRYNDHDYHDQNLAFYDHQLESENVYIGHSNSLQFLDFQLNYLHDFGGEFGLNPKGGNLQILKNGDIIDELCWGDFTSETCRVSLAAFSPEEKSNTSLLRNLSKEHFPFESSKYYPTPEALRAVVFTTLPMGGGQNSGNEIEHQPKPDKDYEICANLEITEYLTYYQDYATEQFVEIHNISDSLQNISHCIFNYGDNNLKLRGSLLPDQYYAIQNPPFNIYKNPSSEKNIFKILTETGQEVDSVVQAPKQTQGTSRAKFKDEQGRAVWRRTYRPTPFEANIFQEFRSCPVGQEINPETGRCRNIPKPQPKPNPTPNVDGGSPGTVKPPEPSGDSTAPSGDKYKPCAPGWYRHPETHRCRKIPVEEQPKPCAAGWYRSPETGRCRKIPVEEQPKPCPAGQYRNPETGRCKKIDGGDSSPAPSPCKEGWYRHPETGRCRKIPTEPEYKPCQEGYERNPETHRCRKIQTSSGTEHPVKPTPPPVEPSKPKFPSFGDFTAGSALIAATLGGASMIALQFKDSIKKSIMGLWPRKKS